MRTFQFLRQVTANVTTMRLQSLLHLVSCILIISKDFLSSYLYCCDLFSACALIQQTGKYLENWFCGARVLAAALPPAIRISLIRTGSTAFAFLQGLRSDEGTIQLYLFVFISSLRPRVIFFNRADLMVCDCAIYFNILLLP